MTGDVDAMELAPYQPRVTPLTEPFWASLDQGVLSICRCDDCGKYEHPPLLACRHCGGATSFSPVSGRGHLYSYTVTHHQAVPAALRAVPYAVGVIELAEQSGLRIVAPVVDAAFDELHPELEIVIGVEPLPGGQRHIPVARLARNTPSAPAR